MANIGFTKKEKEFFFKEKNVYSSFGRDSKDYIMLHIYDLDGELIESEAFGNGEVGNITENYVDLNIGQQLRDLGYSKGTYKITYKFLRKLAGKEGEVFVNGEGAIYVGKVQVKVINGETRYFRTIDKSSTGTQAKDNNQVDELYPRNLKYFIDKISDDRTEVIVSTQDFKNKTYFKNFTEMGKYIKYQSLKGAGQFGKVKFDENDPYILEFPINPRDRGFTQNMVGGEIVIPSLYQVTPTEEKIIKEFVERDVETTNQRPPLPKQPFDEKDPPAQKYAEKEPIPNMEEYNKKEEEYIEQQDNYRDDFDSVCFVGSTRIKLSNGRQVPIKSLRIGMKVRTTQGTARIKKVLKTDKGYGGRLSKFGSLVTTDGHPIKHKGRWYKADEIGKPFMSKPLVVYNLVLERHHTIYANNVVAATDGKWKSLSHFEMWRDTKFNMAREAYDDSGEQSGGGTAGGGQSYSPPPIANEEIVEPEDTSTRTNDELIDDLIYQAKIGKNLDETDETWDDLPQQEKKELIKTIVVTLPTVFLDYKATIVEVLDNNRIRVNKSYNDGVNETGHDGGDDSKLEHLQWYVQYLKTNLYRFKTYMVINDDYYLIINQNDNFCKSVEERETKKVLKLKQPLKDTVDELDKVYFVEKRLEDYEDTIAVVPFVDEDPVALFLELPNLNSVDNPINFKGTDFKTHNQLLGDDKQVNEDIERELVSGSLLNVQVNIDYQKRTTDLEEYNDVGFGNFVNFSSAKARLRNFKRKLELIEGYSATSQSLLNVTSSLSTIQTNESKRTRVINSFDPYEHYLYFESSSYVSSSEGQFHDTSWPKETTSKPYRLTHTTSSTTWYDTMYESASLYDRMNRDTLSNNIPKHVTSDTENNVFIEFVDMVGQQFDEVWTYTKHFTDVNQKVENVSEGISKDIASYYAKSLGLELVNGNDLLILPEYLLGKNADGSTKYESSQEAVTEEIWKRILGSLPFFLKSKGTIRALKGLLNCYGIPSSILRVREYGGPDKGTRVSYEVKRKFTYALDFHSSQYITSNWLTDTATSRVPDTVEFRFRTPKSQDMVVVQKGAKWAIQLQDNGSTDNYGYLRFAVSASTGVQYITSSLQPFYNDEMWSVMLSRVSASDGSVLPSDDILQNVKYELVAKQYDGSQEKIKFETSESLTTGIAAAGNAVNAAFTSSELLYLGGNGSNWGTQYSGSMMEFRLWSEPLSQSVFDNHVRAPKSYNGNSISSSYENFVLRLPLDENVNLNSSPQITNKAFPGTYNASGSAASYTKNDYRSLVDLEQLKVPNFGPSRRNATKIRIEDHKLTGQLSPDVRREKSSQDFAPIDSEKVGIYFSPVDVVNEDIMYSLADFNFDDEIGDPRDEYKYHYRGLRGTARNYWKKYSSPNNFFDYLRILSFYDAGVFTQTKALIPARAKASVGILIEPNILQRNKEVIGKEPEFDNQYYENANEFEEGLNVLRFVSGSKDDAFFDISSTYDTYNSELNLHHEESGSLGSLGKPTLVKIGQIDKKTEYNTLYATASVTLGSDGQFFSESIQPNINSSRLSEHNEEKEFFYSSSLSASLHKPYSASFKPSEYQSMSYDTQLFRVFVQGSLLTIENTIDSREPVEVNVTTPTTLITQEPGESKLKVK